MCLLFILLLLFVLYCLMYNNDPLASVAKNQLKKKANCVEFNHEKCLQLGT